jgi:hypothetical protein
MRHLTPTLSAFATGRTIAPLWVSPSGRAFYPIAGGAPDDPPADPPADPPKPNDPPADPPSDPGKTFTQADVERIIAGRLSKYADYDEVKQQLTELQQANQTESEKALSEARKEGRKEGLLEGGKTLALEVFNGAAGRRNDEYDTAPALALIDLGKFVKDDGTVDREGITKAVEQLVPEKQQAPPGYGGGPRKTDKPEPSPGLGRLRAAYGSTSK